MKKPDWKNTEFDVIKAYDSEETCNSVLICTLRVNKKSEAHGYLTGDESINYYINIIKYIFGVFQKSKPDSDSQFVGYIERYYPDVFYVVKNSYNKQTVRI